MLKRRIGIYELICVLSYEIMRTRSDKQVAKGRRARAVKKALFFTCLILFIYTVLNSYSYRRGYIYIIYIIYLYTYIVPITERKNRNFDLCLVRSVVSHSQCRQANLWPARKYCVRACIAIACSRSKTCLHELDEKTKSRNCRPRMVNIQWFEYGSTSKRRM